MNAGMKSGYARTESSCHHMCEVSKPKWRTRSWIGSQLAKTPKKRRSRTTVRQTCSLPPVESWARAASAWRPPRANATGMSICTIEASSGLEMKPQLARHPATQDVAEDVLLDTRVRKVHGAYGDRHVVRERPAGCRAPERVGSRRPDVGLDVHPVRRRRVVHGQGAEEGAGRHAHSRVDAVAGREVHGDRPSALLAHVRVRLKRVVREGRELAREARVRGNLDSTVHDAPEIPVAERLRERDLVEQGRRKRPAGRRRGGAVVLDGDEEDAILRDVVVRGDRHGP